MERIELHSLGALQFAIRRHDHGRTVLECLTPPDSLEDARDALEGYEGTDHDAKTQPAGCQED